MSRVNQRSYNLSIFGRDQQLLTESTPTSLLTLTTGQEEIVCYHHNDLFDITNVGPCSAMQCAGADLEPCRCRVHASDQYILLAWTQVPHRELPSCDKGDFRGQGQKPKRHHGHVKRILREAAGTRPSTRLQ